MQVLVSLQGPVTVLPGELNNWKSQGLKSSNSLKSQVPRECACLGSLLLSSYRKVYPYLVISLKHPLHGFYCYASWKHSFDMHLLQSRGILRQAPSSWSQRWCLSMRLAFVHLYANQACLHTKFDMLAWYAMHNPRKVILICNTWLLLHIFSNCRQATSDSTVCGEAIW